MKDEMLLYHASYSEIKSIELKYCKKGLDFGCGFYTTSSYEQAYQYVPQAVKKHNFQINAADIIGGKIADDQTRRTLIDYINGAYGRPGSARADQLALEMLLPNRLKDQFCFRTESAIKSLEFIRSERYGDIN